VIARVTITRRPQISDPQGTAVGRALADLGYGEVGRVRIDRIVDLHIDGTDEALALRRVDEMCAKVLANPVMEDYRIEILEGAG
jgi:phosphoribosylformylglycinamidine synthase